MARTRLLVCDHVSECGSLGSVLGTTTMTRAWDTGVWLCGLGAWLPACTHAQSLFGAISEIPEQSMDVDDAGAELFDRILDKDVTRLQQLTPCDGQVPGVR